MTPVLQTTNNPNANRKNAIGHVNIYRDHNPMYKTTKIFLLSEEGQCEDADASLKKDGMCQWHLPL